MIEVEIRAKVESFDNIKKKIEEIGANLEKTVKQADRVYGREKDLDSEHQLIDGSVSSRIREVGDRKTIDFKEILRTKGGFELNFKVTDISVAERFLQKLDFEEAFTVRKTRDKYSYKDFAICLDNVEKLGYFIEIEKTLESDAGAEEARNECIKLLNILAPNAQIENRKYGDLMQEIKNKAI